MVKLAIVILNWNGIDFLRRFLPSVINYSLYDDSEIWVADNGSSDGSQDIVRKEFPDVRLLEFDRNYGFTGGYNRALNEINAAYYVLLNSDVEVTDGWIGPMLSIMEDDKTVAACMPKIKDLKRKDYFEYAGASGGFIDFMGYPFCRGRIFHVLERDNGQYDDQREVFWATGACMMVRGADWHEAGGLDDTFFAHMEEIDLCWRFKNSGKKILVCPSSVVYHLGGGTLHRSNPRKTFWNFRNSLLLLLKNLPAGRLYLLPLRLLLDWLSIIKFLGSLSFGSAFAVLRAHLSFFVQVSRFWKKRGRLRQPGFLPAGKKEIYPRSIVVEFFIRRKRYFSTLDW